jgi:hypothetical protein
MTTRTVTMSHSELDRFGVITRARERRLTQTEAARILDLSVRQVQRLCATVAQQGADGLVSRKRGRPSSRRFADPFRRARSYAFDGTRRSAREQRTAQQELSFTAISQRKQHAIDSFTMNDIPRQDLVLSALRAFLGRIHTSIRLVKIKAIDSTLLLTVIVDSDPGEQVKEDISEAATEIITDFPTFSRISEQVEINTAALPSEDLIKEGWIYQRSERSA